MFLMRCRLKPRDSFWRFSQYMLAIMQPFLFRLVPRPQALAVVHLLAVLPDGPGVQYAPGWGQPLFYEKFDGHEDL